MDPSFRWDDGIGVFAGMTGLVCRRDDGIGVSARMTVWTRPG